MPGRAGAKGNMRRGQCLIPGLRLTLMPLGLSAGHRAGAAQGCCRQLVGRRTAGGEGPLGVRSAWTSSHHQYKSCMPRNYRERRGNFCSGRGCGEGWHTAP